MKQFISTTAIILGLSQSAVASEVPTSFIYQGRLFRGNGTSTVESSNVEFKIQLRSPDGLCLLFEETHVRDMSGSGGTFSLIIGEGTNTGASGLNLMQVFNNADSKIGAAGCTYLPISGDSRRLRLSWSDGTETVALPTDQQIRSVPYATHAQTLQGLTKSAFIQTSAQITQSKLENLLSNSNELIAIANGTSNQYAKATATSVAGRETDLSTLTDGQVLSWNATANRWQPSTLAQGTLSSVTAGAGLVGGTITNAGVISLAPAGTVGTYTKVTTDVFGRVMTGSNLLETDLPQISTPGKVSGSSIVSGTIGGLTSIQTSGNVTAAAVSGTSVSSQQIRLFEVTNTRRIALSTPAALINDYTLTLPVTAGSAGQVLSTDGTGNLSWTDRTEGTVESVSTTSPLVKSGTAANPVLALAPATSAGQTLRWSGTSWSAGFPNLSQMRGIANVEQLPTNCSASQTLTYLSLTDTFICTNIAITASQVSGLTSALLAAVGTTAGSVASGNDPRLVNAIQNTALAGGDLSGSLLAPQVVKLQGTAVSATIPTAGQVLTYSPLSQTWVPKTFESSDLNGTMDASRGGTGHSTYAAGEILVGNNSGGLTKTTITGTSGVHVASSNGTITVTANAGTTANKLVQLDSSARLPAVDGSQLTNLPIPFTQMQVFNFSGTFTVPAGVQKVFVQVWGAGGGGGSGVSGVLAAGDGGAGGGGGGYGAGFVNVTSGPVVITVGQGGSNGALGANGLPGGSSSFGAALTATGGVGGQASSKTVSVGGTSASSLNANGSYGFPALDDYGGAGGSGGGGGGTGSPGGVTSTIAVLDGQAPGGGGGGGSGGALGVSVGGKGANGRVVVWW